jgi:2-amino-4-hydroxy-6-hydroxymethyldihydropteridine diphosphokinase
MALDLDAAVIVALGCNLQGPFDSRQQLLEAALARFADAGIAVVARSSWWRSAAWPDPADPEFLNAVAIVRTRLPPRSLMAFMIGLEAIFGRTRADANAPRTLDLDLIAYGRLQLETPGLTLPHPRAHERRFVMGPLAQIAPDWRHPLSGETAADLAARSPAGADATPLADSAE